MSHLKNRGIFKLLFFSLPSAFGSIKVQTRNIFRLFSGLRNSSFSLFSCLFFLMTAEKHMEIFRYLEP